MKPMTTKIAHIDTEKNLLYIKIEETDSVFVYAIDKEAWTYYCKWCDWIDRKSKPRKKE